jgi:hypothetical protein
MKIEEKTIPFEVFEGDIFPLYSSLITAYHLLEIK